MAKIYPFLKNGVQIGWHADLGKQPDGKRVRRFFGLEDRKAAELFVEDHGKDAIGAEDLLENKNEILRAMERCRLMGVTIEGVVEFYAKHGQQKVPISRANCIEAWCFEKEKAKQKWAYIKATSKHMKRFADFVGPCNMGDLTSQQVDDFIYKKHAHTDGWTQHGLLRDLGVLFNFAVSKGYMPFNLTTKVVQPKRLKKKPVLITPSDYTTLLQRCLDKGWNDRLAVYLLVGFCGIRTEEASLLEWKHIDFDNAKVDVPAEIAKKGRWRKNVIPATAMVWFNLIRDDRRTGRIIGDNAVALLRTAVKFAHIKHTTNCIRHSFASYALESGWTLDQVAKYMGHIGELNTLHVHYKGVAETADAKAWWEIAPKTVTS